jgi:hypothetical protein
VEQLADDDLDLLEMQSRLRGDRDGSYRDEVLQRLAALHAKADAAMRRGLAPADYQAAERLKEGSEAAARIVAAAWRAAQGAR